MSDNVIGLNGEVRDLRVASGEVVSVLEDLLDRARSGEVVGLATSVLYYDNGTGRFVAGQYLSSAAVGSVALLHHAVCADFFGGVR